MRDVILVTAHCNTQKKEDILRNLVNKINQIGGFDTFVISHTPIPVDIQSKSNFCFYDFDNNLTDDPDLRTKFWINTGYGKIITNCYTESTTTLAVYRLMRYGLKFCKSLGYKKAHFLEYDTDLESLDELVENSTILDYKDCVFYTNDGTIESFLYGPIMSINLNRIDSELLTYDETQIIQKIKNSDMKMCEDHTKIILTKTGNFKIKNRYDLSKSGIATGLVFGGKDKNKEHDIYTPFWDQRESMLKFFYWSKSSNTINLQIIINQSNFMSSQILPGHWNVTNLGSDIDQNLKLMIIVDEELVRNYDFSHLNLENFKMNNKIIID